MESQHSDEATQAGRQARTRVGRPGGLGSAQRMGTECSYEDLKARLERVLIMRSNGKSELLCHENIITGLLIGHIRGC